MKRKKFLALVFALSIALTSVMFVGNIMKNSVVAYAYSSDKLEYYRVSQTGLIEFDSTRGPFYCIDFNNGKIIDCTSEGAELLECVLSEDKSNLKLTVYSDELPENKTYNFNLGNFLSDDYKQIIGVSDDKSQYDYIEYYRNVLDFDSTNGPWYEIDLNSKQILNCSSDGAVLKKCEVDGDTVLIEVYSDELPYNMTYIFDRNISNDDLSKGEQQIQGISDDGKQYDYIEYFYDELKFDSERGPIYKIDLTAKQILDNGSNSILKKCEIGGDTILIEVYSDELPYNMTYLFDRSLLYDENDNNEYLKRMEISGNCLISFETSNGMYCQIDYINSEITDCSYDDAKLTECVLSEDKTSLSVTIQSDELSSEATYSFGLPSDGMTDYEAMGISEEKNRRDFVQWYTVNSDGTIEFDSVIGPYYKIDYKNKTILGCTSDGAIINNLSVNGDILSITLLSDELNSEYTYSFDLTKNFNEVSDDYDGSGYSTDRVNGMKDMVEYYNVLPDNMLEFDSECGPYYLIDLVKKEIVSCTSDSIYPEEPKAKLIDCVVIEDCITISVYSAELPYEMTYVFDLKSNEQVAGFVNNDIDDNEIISAMIDDIANGRYEGEGVNEETKDNIVKAKKEGKRLTFHVDCHCKSDKKVDKNIKEKIKKYNEDKQYDILQYLDISIAVYADGDLLGYITNLDENIIFSMNLSSKIYDEDGSYCVLRIHGEDIDCLDTVKGKDNTLSFKTDRFSDYILVKLNSFASYDGYDFYKEENGDVRCYDSNGKAVINDFKCDGTYTYYFQLDGTAMKDRLTYHPDGEHVIYFDSEGHEVFSDFANVKKTIAGEAVDDYCFFNVFGYMYVDVVTYDKSGSVLYYANAYGVMEMGKWFQFSDNVTWADGREGDEFKGGYGYATEDGTLMTNTQTYDWEGRSCYLQGNGVALY